MFILEVCSNQILPTGPSTQIPWKKSIFYNIILYFCVLQFTPMQSVNHWRLFNAAAGQEKNDLHSHSCLTRWKYGTFSHPPFTHRQWERQRDGGLWRRLWQSDTPARNAQTRPGPGAVAAAQTSWRGRQTSPPASRSPPSPVSRTGRTESWNLEEFVSKRWVIFFLFHKITSFKVEMAWVQTVNKFFDVRCVNW